jgi:hypothetical protein
MKTRAGLWLTGVLAGVLAPGPATTAAETVVLPVVARGVPGINGSVWDSEVRITGRSVGLPGPIKRLWVALPGGGFVDEPATAPRWEFPSPTCVEPCNLAGMVVLTGDRLLQGTDAPKGAVALDVATGNQVFLHNSNTLGQPRLPQDTEGPACCLPGNGQLIRGLTDPLVGHGSIPWITGGTSPYRVSVGVINPTAVPRTIEVSVGPLTPWAGSMPTGPPDGTYWLGYQGGNGPILAIDLQPWGFRQIDNLASVLLQECPSCHWQGSVAPSAIYLHSDTELPFYAYASVIWTPLNDPEFIAAEPSVP